MPSIEKIKKLKQESILLKTKIEGILKPVADPYKELVHQEKIREAVYEIPQELSEQEAMILTLGAIFQDEILEDMRTSSSSAGSSATSFGVIYVLENIFSSIETPGRLGNVPIKIGEGREIAVNAFKNFSSGDITDVQEMGKSVISKMYEYISDKVIEDSGQSITAGMIAKMALELMDNPDLELEEVLGQNEKEQLRAFVEAYDMKILAWDAELQLKENLPEKNSPEREEQLKNFLLSTAMVQKYNAEIDQKSTDVADYVYKYVITAGRKNGLNDRIIQDPVINKMRSDLASGVCKNTMSSMQVILGSPENEEPAKEAYWEEIKKTDLYKDLMNADKESFDKLLESTKNVALPEISEFEDILTDRKIDNDEITHTLIDNFENTFQEVFPVLKEKLLRESEIKDILGDLNLEKASDRLIGSMSKMHRYISLVKEGVADAANPEIYMKYLEAIEKVVEKTEAFYQKENENYVPFTQEGLKELQESYKEAYSLAKQMKIFAVCSALENDIIVLGTLDKKNLTTLPQAMDAAKTVSLDITGSQLSTVSGQASSRIPITYTDINGQEQKGFFTEKTEKVSAQLAFRNIINELDEKYPNMKDIAAALREGWKKDNNLGGIFEWTYYKSSTDEPTREEARENFFITLLDNLKDMNVNVDSFQETLQEHKEEAISYFSDIVTKMTSAINLDKLYSLKMDLPQSEKIRIDNRNVAMSAVADLLEIPDIVARSKNMELQNGDQVIEGTFMENAKGVDISNLPKDHPMRSYGNEVYDNSKGLKSLADLQVIDYICQNIDRHPRNMLYQFDTTDPEHPKFIGVQGIDNDASFGIMTDDKQIKKNDNHITILENMGVISQSVFDSIMNMDPDVFKLSLQKQGLNKKEIEAACTRMENLKTKVLEDATYFKDKPAGELEKGKIRLVRDEDFEKLSIDKILEVSPDAKMFKYIKNSIMNGVPVTEDFYVKEEANIKERMKKLANDVGEKKIELDVSEVNLTDKKYYQKVQRDLSKMLLESMRADDSLLRGSSNEFKNVQKCLKDSIELLGKMKNPKPEDSERLNDSLKKILDATNKYNQHKKEKSSGSEYERKRKDVIADIRKAVSGKMTAITKENKKVNSKQQDEAERVKKSDENKQQIKVFISNLMTWNEKQPKEQQDRALASAILAGSMAEYAFKCIGVGKQDSLFKMTQEQFNNKIEELVESKQFQTYYQSMDKDKLAENLVSQKPIESYFEDFRKVNTASEQIQKSENPPSSNLQKDGPEVKLMNN